MTGLHGVSLKNNILINMFGPLAIIYILGCNKKTLFIALIGFCLSSLTMGIGGLAWYYLHCPKTNNFNNLSMNAN